MARSATSATAEQCAASSEEMSAQATILDQVVSRFKLRGMANSFSSRGAGAKPLVLPQDRTVRSAQERGRLLPERGRMARRFDRLAVALTVGDVEELAS